MEQNKKAITSKHEVLYKNNVVNNAVLKLAESNLSKKEIEAYIELSELIKQVIKIDEKAICGFLIIAMELMHKSGKTIDFEKYTDDDITTHNDILELMIYFKRVIVVALVNRIDIFQLNDQIDELFFNAGFLQNDINSN